MPIKDPNMYPIEWAIFSFTIRYVRAGGKCERCGIENYSINFRGSKVVLTVAHLDHADGPCRCKADTGAGRSELNSRPNTVISSLKGWKMAHIEEIENDLVVIPPVVPGAKHEARCHLCTWTFHKWSDNEARSWLRAHIIDAHLRPLADRPFIKGDGPATS